MLVCVAVSSLPEWLARYKKPRYATSNSNQHTFLDLLYMPMEHIFEPSEHTEQRNILIINCVNGICSLTRCLTLSRSPLPWSEFLYNWWEISS